MYMTKPATTESSLTQPAVAIAMRSVYSGGTQERRKSLEFFSFDRNYVQRLTAGDGETERHFVGYFSPLLLVKLRQRLRSREELEDLRQEVFLRVLRSLRRGGVQHPECLGAYVHSVCNKVILEHFRNRARHEQWDEAAIEPRDPDNGIERELVTQETRRHMHSLIEEMAPKDRALIRAIFLDERDKDSVCREQGVGRDYLRVLLHRAKKRFRQLLEEKQAAAAVRPVTNSLDSTQQP